MPLFSTAARSISQQSSQSTPQVNEHHLTEQERDDFVNNAFGMDNDEDDDDDVDAEDEDEEGEGEDETGLVVDSIFKAHIVDKTRNGYRRCQKKFACWIFKQSSCHANRTERDRFKQLLHAELFNALTQENLSTHPKLEKKTLPFI